MASSSGSEERRSEPDPHSSFRLEITLAIGYTRRRAITGKWEAGIVSVVLLVAGIIVTLLILARLFQISLP